MTLERLGTINQAIKQVSRKYSGSSTIFVLITVAGWKYRDCSVPDKQPLPDKRPCTAFQGATVAASIQMYGILILDKHPCRSKPHVMFKYPWALTRML